MTSSSSSADAPAGPFPWVGLLTLAAAIFVMVTSEFLPTGLLPQIAADLDVTEPQVGLLVTIFAATVVVSTAPLAALTHRYSRKWLLIAVTQHLAAVQRIGQQAHAVELLVGARVGLLRHAQRQAADLPQRRAAARLLLGRGGHAGGGQREREGKPERVHGASVETCWSHFELISSKRQVTPLLSARAAATAAACP